MCFLLICFNVEKLNKRKITQGKKNIKKRKYRVTPTENNSVFKYLFEHMEQYLSTGISVINEKDSLHFYSHGCIYKKSI